MYRNTSKHMMVGYVDTSYTIGIVETKTDCTGCQRVLPNNAMRSFSKKLSRFLPVCFTIVILQRLTNPKPKNGRPFGPSVP